MATERVLATLDSEVIAEIRRIVGARRASAFLTEAAREKLKRARILAFLRKLDDEHGPVPEETEREAEKRIARVLGS